MIHRILHCIIILSMFMTSYSCRVRKEYIEKNGLHSDDKPSQIAMDLGKKGKEQKRAYLKQLKRTNKEIKKRNKKKQKGNYYR